MTDIIDNSNKFIVTNSLRKILIIPGPVVLSVSIKNETLIVNCKYKRYSIKILPGFNIQHNFESIKKPEILTKQPFSSNSNYSPESGYNTGYHYSTSGNFNNSGQLINKTYVPVHNYYKESNSSTETLSSAVYPYNRNLSLVQKNELDYFALNSSFIVNMINETQKNLNLNYYPITLDPKELDENEELNKRPQFDKISLMWSKNGACLFRRGFIERETNTILQKSENELLDKMTQKIQNSNKKVIFTSTRIFDCQDLKANNYEIISIEKFYFDIIGPKSGSGIYSSSEFFIFDSLRRNEYLSKWINTALNCAYYLLQFQPVVIEDAKDIRFSVIIGSLVKIIIDPMYTSFEGFINLIQSTWMNIDWYDNVGEQKLSLFFYWLICVKFLFFLTPTKFEFSYWLLEYIMKHIWSTEYFEFTGKGADRSIFDKLNSPNFYNLCYVSSASIYLTLQSYYGQSKSDIWCLTFEKSKLEIPEYELEKFFKAENKISPLNYRWFHENSKTFGIIKNNKDYISFVEKSYFDPDMD